MLLIKWQKDNHIAMPIDHAIAASVLLIIRAIQAFFAASGSELSSI